MIEGILRMSVMGAVVIAMVLLLRLCLRRLPKIFSYALWAIVLFRLLCPVSVSLPISVFNLLGAQDATHNVGVDSQLPPRSEPGNGQAVFMEQEKTPVSGTNASSKEQLSSQGEQKEQPVTEIPEETAADSWKNICTVVWLSGVLGMFVYAIFDMKRLHKMVRGASLDRDNIYLLEGISSPFVAGIVRPRIYLPYGLSQQEREYVLLHEKTHIRRGDPMFRMLAYLALSLHWFNPLVWAAFFISGRDMEMSCDEMVLRRLGADIKCEYSTSLLVMAQGKGLVTNISLAFGEGDTGKRIKNVLNYKKATVQAAVIGAMVVALALAALGTNSMEQALAEDSGDGAQKGNGSQTEKVVQAAGADVSQADVLTPELLCQIADRGELESCDFGAFANGSREASEDASLDYHVRFTFATDLGDLVLDASYWEEDGALAMVSLVRQWDSERLLVYSSDSDDYGTSGPPTGAKIEAFLTGSTTISIRSISRSARCVDSYVAPDEEWEWHFGEELFFAQDCSFFINDARDTMSPQKVSFTAFAEVIEQGEQILNKPCVVEMGDDDLVHSITLVSARYLNGVSYAAMGPWGFFENTAALYPDYAKQYPIVRTETMDIASAPGDETIEIRKGYREEDGLDAADIAFKDQNGNMLYSFMVLNEGMCLCNLYVGRMDGAGDPFILEVHLENRDTYGEYSYYVYTLGKENGTYVQTAGSRIEWEKDGLLVYDAMEMDIFFHMLGHYLEESHLLAGTEWREDGTMGIRTDPVCDADLFTYANFKPPCFPDPYEAQDVP